MDTESSIRSAALLLPPARFNKTESFLALLVYSSLLLNKVEIAVDTDSGVRSMHMSVFSKMISIETPFCESRIPEPESCTWCALVG